MERTKDSVVDSISCALVIDFLEESGHHGTAQDLIDLKGQTFPDLCGLTLQNVVSYSEVQQTEESSNCNGDDLEQVCALNSFYDKNFLNLLFLFQAVDEIAASLVHDYLKATGFESLADELQKHRNVIDLQGVNLAEVAKCHEKKHRPSKNRVSEKMLENCLKEVSEKVPMKSAFPELRKHLESPDCNVPSDVVNVMSYVLNQDFQICKLDAMGRSYKTLADVRKQLQAVEPLFKVGYFTKELFGEESDEFKIRKQWNHLSAVVTLENPQLCIKSMNEFRSCPLKYCRFALGAYLSKTLNGIRPAEKVFQCLLRLICYKVHGAGNYKFSEADDELIQNLVRMYDGATGLAARQASIALNLPENNIFYRIRILKLARSVTKRGIYSSIEDELIMRYFFITRNLPCSVEGCKTYLHKTEFIELASSLGRSINSVYQRWRAVLTFVLLSYHFGCLHMPWKKDFVKFVIEEKTVGVQNLNFQDVQAKWPFLAQDSVLAYLPYLRSKSKERQPLWKSLQDNYDKIRDYTRSKAQTKRREDIVNLYTKIMEEKERAAKQ